MTKKIKLGFIEKKLERSVPFPLVASDRNAYCLEVDMSKYQAAEKLFIYAIRADGEVICDSADADAEIITYNLKQSMYSVPGELKLRLVLGGGEDSVLTAAELSLDVLSGTFDGTPAEDGVTVEDFILRLSEVEEQIGDIDSALGGIIAIQNELIGGEGV